MCRPWPKPRPRCSSSRSWAGHTGWIAAAAGLAGNGQDEAPHLILFPERPFAEEAFFEAVKSTVARLGHCVVVVSEGLRDGNGRFLAETGHKDAFGHAQLGGAGQVIAELVRGSASASRCIGPCPIIFSALRATSPREPTLSRPVPSARRRCASRSQA